MTTPTLVPVAGRVPMFLSSGYTTNGLSVTPAALSSNGCAHDNITTHSHTNAVAMG